jgi:hypothetical protein
MGIPEKLCGVNKKVPKEHLKELFFLYYLLLKLRELGYMTALHQQLNSSADASGVVCSEIVTILPTYRA